MTIDLHVHSNCSDGAFTVPEIMKEARRRCIRLLAITDHDTAECQEEAIGVAGDCGIQYISGVELNITYKNPQPSCDSSTSLDVLGYKFDVVDKSLRKELHRIARYREKRAEKILVKVDSKLRNMGAEGLTRDDFEKIKQSADGVLGRPHIADYLVGKGIVSTKQDAFDRYLVKCNVPKFPLHLDTASRMIRDAGGIAVLAHPNDSHGTSLIGLTRVLQEQTEIIQEFMLEHIDGIECWHPRHNASTTDHYLRFAKKHNLIVTGGSDCHQKPILMGRMDIPYYVAAQFDI